MNRYWTIIIVIFSAVEFLHADDRLSIESGKDPDHLPYQAVIINQYTNGAGRQSLPVPAQCLQYAHGEETLSVGATALNPQTLDGTPALITFYSTRDWTPTKSQSIDLILNDFVLFYDSSAQGPAALVSGYRQDSAFLCKVLPGSSIPQYLFVANGFDRTHAPWRGLREFVYAGDVDGDGTEEMIFRVGSARMPSQQRLVCINTDAMTVRWAISFPYFTTQVILEKCDRHGPNALLIVGSASRPEQPTPSFTDLYSHLIKISGSGEVLFNRVIGKTGENVPLAYDRSTHRAYVGHNLPLLANYDSADTCLPHDRLSALDCTDSVLVTIDLPHMMFDLWIDDLGHDSIPELYALAPRSMVQVYDTLLNKIAESEEIPTLGSYCGHADDLVRPGPNLIFATDQQVTLYSSAFRMLVSAPFAAQRVQSLSAVGEQPPMLLASSANGYVVIRIQERSLREYLLVLYYDYRYYLVGGFAALLVGLLVVSYFGRRVQAQKREIESAHHELAATHDELVGTHQTLQEAQARMIEQEKYRLAQDIAGSFAHEIRNALFPIDMSIAKIADVFRDTPVDEARLKKLLGLCQQSVTRALSLTDSIATYTKLEAQYAPTMTQVAATVGDALTANHQRIVEQLVDISVNGDQQAEVAVREEHLYMVVNNLLLNALDAVTGQPLPRITLSWSTTAKNLELRCADNGCGIADTDKARILEAFYSTKPNGGTGLGLAIVNRLVDMYGGAISFTSGLNEGTTFVVTLQRHPHNENPGNGL